MINDSKYNDKGLHHLWNPICTPGVKRHPAQYGRALPGWYLNPGKCVGSPYNLQVVPGSSDISWPIAQRHESRQPKNKYTQIKTKTFTYLQVYHCSDKRCKRAVEPDGPQCLHIKYINLNRNCCLVESVYCSKCTARNQIVHINFKLTFK